MAKHKSGGDWLEVIAKESELDKDLVESVLAGNHIRPSPTSIAPRRMLIKRIYFSGEKVDTANAGPFEFEWKDLEAGLWGLITESNLKGKSTVLEVIRWMLRGRPSGALQDDVRGWIKHIALDFELDGVLHEIRAETNQATTGHLVRSEGGTEHELATFKSDEEFESVMSDFFMRELSLDPVTVVTSGEEFEAGKATTHQWPWLSGALYIGTDYSALLGDVIMGGLATRIMQMFLGLPWVSTLCEAKAAQQKLSLEKNARARRKKFVLDGRSARKDSFTNVLEQKKAQLEALPSDDAIREMLQRALEERALQGREAHSIRERADSAQANLRVAQQYLLEDQNEHQAVIDGIAAGQVFRLLTPSCCPRCDRSITDDRKRKERDAGACSVCGEEISSENGDSEALEAAVSRLEASAKAVTAAKSDLQSVEAKRAEVDRRIAEIDQRIANLELQLIQYSKRQELRVEIKVLEARIEETTYDPEPEPDDLISIQSQVFECAVSETDRRVKAVQEGLLDEVSKKILEYSKRFGMENYTKVVLRGNANLPIEKGGESTSFSKVTPGEKLRLKVATVLSLLSVAESRGLGRHPGLLLIDSPGAQEVAPGDLEQLISGLAEVTGELGHLQVFVGALASPAITHNISASRMRYAHGHDSLW